MDTSDSIACLLCIAMMALALLIADRYLRVSRFLEPFAGSMNTQCGVDLPPCDFPLQCVNGYCKSVSPPRLPVSTGLPVLP
jgi:hypothetical protein